MCVYKVSVELRTKRNTGCTASDKRGRDYARSGARAGGGEARVAGREGARSTLHT